ACASISTCFVCLSFFFSSRRRHTRFSRDWSSDVCSSDLFRQIPNSGAVSMQRSGALRVRPAARHRRPGPLALAARPDSPRRWTPLSHTPATRTADAPSGAGPAPLLHARDLAKSYEGRPVLDGVSLDVAPG